jgi:3'-phosphoadenosine 5'-phosphosulfate sulfotransferase (PAPS reductase)/FAD synthetase
MKVISETKEETRTIAWVSGGAASAVACYLFYKKAMEEGRELPLFVRIDPLSEHPDTERFVAEVAEKMLGGNEVQIISVHTHGSSIYKDCKNHLDVLRKVRGIRFVSGAPCTRILKREVRERFEIETGMNSHIWGFCKGEETRADKMRVQAGYHHFPLIEEGLTKQDCFELIEGFGILLPEMYRLGFNNNNCYLGCVKGGMGYWNHIRKVFPEHFDKMAKLEREIGHACLKESVLIDGKKVNRKVFLDELDPERGTHEPMYVEDCGSTGEVCEMKMNRGKEHWDE